MTRAREGDGGRGAIDGGGLLADLGAVAGLDDLAVALRDTCRALVARLGAAAAVAVLRDDDSTTAGWVAGPAGADDGAATIERLGRRLRDELGDAAGGSAGGPTDEAAEPSMANGALSLSNPETSWLAAAIRGSDDRIVGGVAILGPAGDGSLEPELGDLLRAAGALLGALVERRRLAHDLDEARRQRRAFFGVLSHELRTPITTIYGGTRVLQSGARLPLDAREQLLEDVAGEAARLYRLIEDLLVLSRDERLLLDASSEPILLQHLVPRVVEAEQERWPRVELRVASRPALPPVAGDPTFVEQVLRNLLTNAAKYAGGGGPIEITVGAEGGGVAVRVLDRGPGVDPVRPEAVFDLFYREARAPSVAQGAGIGLYACRELIRAMGGAIWVQPRQGGGSEFGFRLPLAVTEDGAGPGIGGL